MSTSKAAAPPIIIKKKSGHAGHHGGAWKVAYADFVTAMMALFIVLWLLASSEQVKKAVEGYFKDPLGNPKNAGTAKVGDGKSMALSKEDLKKLKEAIEKALQKAPDFEKIKKFITLAVTKDGLRIELLENKTGVFFESGSPHPTKLMGEILTILAGEMGKLPNTILVEGHTDAAPYQDTSGYSNWELSTDRANAARRFVQEYGVRPDQVKQVRGFADQSLRNTKDPRDASNRRISFIVQNIGADADVPTVAVDNHTVADLKGVDTGKQPQSAGRPQADPGKQGAAGDKPKESGEQPKSPPGELKKKS